MRTPSKYDKFLDERYIPLESKVKVAICVALIILPVVAFYFFFFKPKAEELASLEGKRDGLQQEVLKAQKKAENIEKFQKEFKETEIKFLETADMLPKEKDIPQLLKDISSLGQNAGLDFLYFAPGGETQRDFYADFPINIRVRGPYHNVGYFLDQVSKLNRIVTVSNIQMGSPKKERGEMVLNSSCNLTTYRFTNKPLPSEGAK
ncbi:MAG: pilus assembly protein PilO [Deltaproteobacteria bacterium]|nr:MAG: pilus assembly protein PilO [Deltaproteobacteria bacterium]